MDQTIIRSASTEDAAAVASIYNHYVEHSIITFEEASVSDREMAERMANVVASFPWLVAEEGGRVLGYAYAARWGTRCSYRLSAEASIYLAPDQTGRGRGRALYRELIARLRSSGFHCVIGGVALPNAASVALHENLGFKKVAHFEQVGRKFDRWIDVAYWELLL